MTSLAIDAYAATPDVSTLSCDTGIADVSMASVPAMIATDVSEVRRLVRCGCLVAALAPLVEFGSLIVL